MKRELCFAPTSNQERIVSLDIIRAIALFGILLVNMKFFSTPTLQAEMANVSFSTTLADEISQWFIFIFAEFKFISMFSLLFGIGFLVFMERGERRGANVKKIFVRRLLFLLCVGLFHMFFLWYGDILTFYALLGFVLLIVRFKSPKFLLKATFMTMMIPVLFFLLLAVLLAFVSPTTTTDQANYLSFSEVQTVVEIYGGGSYKEIFMQRLQEIGMILVGNIFVLAVVLSMFFFGMYLWKTGIFTKTQEQIDRVRKIARNSFLIGVVGLVLAIVGKLLYAGGDSPWYFVQYAGLFVSGPSLSVFYIMCILLLLQNKRRLASVAQVLQPVGKMALTNYLMQTILCTFIFYSYGLGLFGKIGPFYGLLFTVMIFLLQIGYSFLWMKRFAFGPMEWLWRNVTYGMSTEKLRMNKQVDQSVER
ncbi:hypothetical protein BKP45_06765 [Anaerobacillus alkalidiazotrophicus]|uniref:DUF418 domain-containing protein n=1 Tax=Anaerobacillus alkalidiazotrophicus TaxID=472963 RepID=A0A1S2MF70_9BACI|nr:DUF418 domain-containing protein [Anaerobacillus alkalidiazotrophicus]OIJ22335.1 hypothetical protein BKP45_06765 [Anaerobacillus alkalidiazotrophicus]